MTAAADPNDDAIHLMEHLFSDRPDLIQVWTAFRAAGSTKLTNPAERYFRHDQLAEAQAWALEQDRMGREVYFATHQLLARERQKVNAAAVLALWCETDGVDLAASPIKPTAVVESSPGHFHCYARLEHAIAPDIAEKLNKRWAKSFGADGSGFDLTQLLRWPGTHNHKYDGWPLVKLLDIAEDKTYTLAELERVLPKLPEPSLASSATISAALSDDDNELVGELGQRSPVFGRLYAGDTSDCADARGNIDPSDADWRLIRELLRATGLDADRTERLARQSSLTRPKWDERRSGKNCLRYEIDRAVERWAQDEINPSTWPSLTVGEPGPINSECSAHCVKHLEEIARQAAIIEANKQQLSNQALLFSKPKLKASAKLLGAKLLNRQASLEREGKPAEPFKVCIKRGDASADTPRDWPDDSLSAQLGMSESTIANDLKLLTDPSLGLGLFEKQIEKKVIVTDDGKHLQRPMLWLVPRAPVADQWTTLLSWEPSKTEKPEPTPEQIRCKHHPLTPVEMTQTWMCTSCHRHVKDPRKVMLDPTERLAPDPKNNGLVTGLAEPGEAPDAPSLWDDRSLQPAAPKEQPDSLTRCARCSGPDARDIPSRVLGRPLPLCKKCWTDDRLRDPQIEGLVDAPVSVERTNDPQINGLDGSTPGYGNVGNGLVREYTCHDCGAAADARWGPVIEVQPGIWLHGYPSPCHLEPVAVAS